MQSCTIPSVLGLLGWKLELPMADVPGGCHGYETPHLPRHGPASLLPEPQGQPAKQIQKRRRILAHRDTKPASLHLQMWGMLYILRSARRASRRRSTTIPETCKSPVGARYTEGGHAWRGQAQEITWIKPWGLPLQRLKSSCLSPGKILALGQQA